MTGYDLSNYASKEIAKITIAALFLSILSMWVGWASHSYYATNYVETDKEAYKNGYTNGAHKGILTVVNYDRKNAGEEPYDSYEDFMKDLDERVEKAERTSNFIDDLIRENKAEEFKKADAAKKYPKLWVDKK
jgi:hypothetical protein